MASGQVHEYIRCLAWLALVLVLGAANCAHHVQYLSILVSPFPHQGKVQVRSFVVQGRAEGPKNMQLCHAGTVDSPAAGGYQVQQDILGWCLWHHE
jgi:hypothetical protein